MRHHMTKYPSGSGSLASHQIQQPTSYCAPIQHDSQETSFINLMSPSSHSHQSQT